MFNKHDISRNACMLVGGQSRCGYDWWWNSFTGRHSVTGEEKAFFIEFFLCNPASGKDEPIFGQLPDNKENHVRPSYLMIKAGAWGENNAGQLHRFFGWNRIQVDMGVPYSVKADDCYIDEVKTYGTVKVSTEDAANHPEYMCQSGEMSWNLRIDKKVAFNVGYGAGKLFRSLQAFEMFWHAEGMKTAYSGEVIWNGEKYLITPDTCYGYADKNWGKDFTSPWVWLSSNNLTSKITGKKLNNSVFDIGGGCPKVGPIALKRKLLSAYWYEGKGYEFNFSKFWTFTRTKFDCRETDTQIIWHVEQKTWLNRMVTDITCEKKDMLLVNYEAPNGTKRHNRLWNGGNGKGTVKLYRAGKLIDEVIAENVGCEYGEYDPV
ncbi:MAG: hypothetical protein IJW18_03990 [Lachnospiraceae bacterium]|nr:hypothetical protein [Lachnospiraceae bacterium]